MGELGGTVLKHVFRKRDTDKSTKTKYPTIVKTREELDQEALEMEQEEVELAKVPKRQEPKPQ